MSDRDLVDEVIMAVHAGGSLKREILNLVEDIRAEELALRAVAVDLGNDSIAAAYDHCAQIVENEKGISREKREELAKRLRALR